MILMGIGKRWAHKIRSLWVLWVHIELYQPCADSERMIVENLSVVPCGLQKSLRQDHPKIIRKSSENGTKNPQALAAGTAADSFCPTHRGSPFRGGVTVGVVDLLRQRLGSTKI